MFVKIVLGSSVLVDVSMTHGGDDASSVDWVSESHVLLGAAHSHAGEPEQSKSHGYHVFHTKDKSSTDDLGVFLTKSDRGSATRTAVLNLKH